MRRLIGISGATASGKSTIAQGLIEHFKADTNRFSKILADLATTLTIPTDKASLQHLSTTLRETLGEDVLARGMCEWVKKNPTDTIVIEGIRRIVDCDLLSEVARSTGRTWTLLYIEVPYEERFRRINARLMQEGMLPLTPEIFHQLDTQECESELPTLQNRAQHILTNDQPAQDTTKRALTLLQKDTPNI